MKAKEFFTTAKLKRNFLPLFILLAGLVTFTSCENDDDPMPEPETEQTIVDVAGEAGSFTVLLQAAEIAGLANFLSTEKNITVFAPTDAAFSALLSDLGLNSLDDIGATTLAGILSYHVHGEMAYSKDLSTGVLPSLNTSSPDQEALSLMVNIGSDVMINNATVTSPDIMASNGVIHVIDKVLLPPSVVDIATFSESFSSLVDAVLMANLAETLNGDGPFTVFAPTNDAFATLLTTLGINTLNEVSDDDLTAILTYHVLGDNVLSSEISAGTIGTVLGESIDVSINDAVLLNETISVTTTDIQGTNGVVHVVDAVLVPPSLRSNTIADIAATNSEFSILVEALTKADLVGAVGNKEAELTVFAPTNDAFEALLSELGASSLDDIPTTTLSNILLYHVLENKAMSSDLSTNYYPTLSTYSDNPMSIYINVDNGTINSSTKLTEVDIEADNGVIHVVDKVILPPSVVDIAIDNANFSTLVSAVVKAGLVDVLNGDGPFTVFAPTNAAFDALFTTLGISGIDDLTAEQLTPILTYHVVSGNVLSGALTSGEVPTLNTASNLTIDLSSGVMVDESEVVAADIQAANGVVHVIDQVLIPE